MLTLGACGGGRRRHVTPTFVKFPGFTAWCSESMSYAAVRCPIFVQKPAVLDFGLHNTMYPIRRILSSTIWRHIQNATAWNARSRVCGPSFTRSITLMWWDALSISVSGDFRFGLRCEIRVPLGLTPAEMTFVIPGPRWPFWVTIDEFRSSAASIRCRGCYRRQIRVRLSYYGN
jgi:hypothetical protein